MYISNIAFIVNFQAKFYNWKSNPSGNLIRGVANFFFAHAALHTDAAESQSSDNV